MTVEQYLSQMLGDLMLNNARLAAERDALKEQVDAFKSDAAKAKAASENTEKTDK